MKQKWDDETEDEFRERDKKRKKMSNKRGHMRNSKQKNMNFEMTDEKHRKYSKTSKLDDEDHDDQLLHDKDLVEEEDVGVEVQPLLASHSFDRPRQLNDLEEEHYDHMDSGMLREFGIPENIEYDWD